MVDAEGIKTFIKEAWDSDVIPKISEYIKIPNLSPYFVEKGDKTAIENQDKAMALIYDWVKAQDVKGMTHQLEQVEGRTPLLFIEVAASEGVSVEDAGTVLLYGHMDKQPPFTGWLAGLEPYKPVIKDGKLYGRGGADDGYSCFCAITAIRALQKQGVKHARCVIIIEASEESGSPDLPFYIEHFKEKIGSPNLIVCLDSGCGNYDQLWVTSSLRGMVGGKLKVEIISDGVHSGDSSGVIPDTFRIARQLLDRVEDPSTGEILVPELHVEIPEKTKELVSKSSAILGKDGMIDCFPFLEGCKPVQVTEGDQLTELALNRWWRPTLTVIGADGLPPAASAGNVLRPYTTLALSFRLPPTIDTNIVVPALRKVLTDKPPYNAKVTFESEKAGRGWAAPPLAPWLESAAKKASQTFFGKDAVYQGEGGSIPFMGMLGEMFPEAQFFIIGVLGPNSNAHGPNEFLHIDFSSKLTCCVSHVLASHCGTNVDKLNKSSKNGAPPSKKQKVDDITENFGRNKDGTKL